MQARKLSFSTCMNDFLFLFHAYERTDETDLMKFSEAFNEFNETLIKGEYFKSGSLLNWQRGNVVHKYCIEVHNFQESEDCIKGFMVVSANNILEANILVRDMVKITNELTVTVIPILNQWQL
jgi:hypothetical protein